MSPVKEKDPELPSVYEAVHVESPENLAEVALRHAREGAPEGTLVWTTEQAAGSARLGHTWESPGEGLYAAVILRPDFDWRETGQIALVGLVSLGAAVAAMVEPMTELRYRWPNDLLVGGTKIAGLWLHEDRDAGWLTLVLSCNVGKQPEGVFDGGCLLDEGGNPEIGPVQLLEQFTRQFLAWLNRWADEGMEPVRREFRGRSDGSGTPVALVLDKNERLAGMLAGIDASGDLEIDCNEKRRTISIRRFLGLEDIGSESD